MDASTGNSGRADNQQAVVSGSGEKYDRLLATKGRDYLFVYSYTGRPFSVRPGAIAGRSLRAWWFNPRDGRAQLIGVIGASQIGRFSPPGERGDGHDWVLVLDDASRGYPPPGGGGGARLNNGSGRTLLVIENNEMARLAAPTLKIGH